MKVLAWDTSSKTGALVALQGPDLSSEFKLMAEFFIDVELTHSERLLWGVHQILESLRWKIEEIDVFGVGIGPGSFTGLRVGLTLARTFSHFLKKPLVGVSSLAVLAHPLALHFSQPGLPFETLVIATTDASQGELFVLSGKAPAVLGCVKVPELGHPGLWVDEVEEVVVNPSVMIQKLDQNIFKKNDTIRWIAVGEGRHRYLADWKKLPQDRKLEDPLPFLDRVQGRYLAQLVWKAISRQLVSEGQTLSPRYLRASSAELRYKK